MINNKKVEAIINEINRLKKDDHLNDQEITNLFFQTENEIFTMQNDILTKCFMHRTELNIYNNMLVKNKIELPSYFKLIEKPEILILSSERQNMAAKIAELYDKPEEHAEYIAEYLQTNPNNVEHFITQTFPSMYAYFSESNVMKSACSLVNALIDKIDFNLGSKFVKVLFEGSFTFHNFLWTNFRQELIDNFTITRGEEAERKYQLFIDALKVTSASAYDQFFCLNQLASINTEETVKFFLNEIIFPSFVFHERFLSYLIDFESFKSLFDKLFGTDTVVQIPIFAELFSPPRSIDAIPDTMSLNLAKCFTVKMVASDLIQMMKIIKPRQSITNFIESNFEKISTDKKMISMQIVNGFPLEMAPKVKGNPEFAKKFSDIQAESEKFGIDMLHLITTSNIDKENEEFVVYALQKILNMEKDRISRLKHSISMKKTVRRLDEFIKLIETEMTGIDFAFVSSKYAGYKYSVTTNCRPTFFIYYIKYCWRKFSDFPWLKIPIVITKLNAGFTVPLPSIEKFLTQIYDQQNYIVKLSKDEKISEDFENQKEYLLNLIGFLYNAPLGYQVLLIDEIISNIKTMSKFAEGLGMKLSEKTFFKNIFCETDQRKFLATMLAAKQVFDTLLNTTDEIKELRTISETILPWVLSFYNLRDDIITGMQKTCLCKLGY